MAILWRHFFFFETDNPGRYIFIHLLMGAFSIVKNAFILTIATTLFGLLINFIMNILHRVILLVITFLIDVFFFVPSLLFVVSTIALFRPYFSYAIFAIFLSLLLRMTCTIYSMIRKELKKEYVSAIRLDGANKINILRFAILPNIAPDLIVEITHVFSIATLDIATLSYLDLIIQTPFSEWRTMLENVLKFIYIPPWIVVIPGISIMISILSINLLGNGIRNAMNNMETE